MGSRFPPQRSEGVDEGPLKLGYALVPKLTDAATQVQLERRTDYEASFLA